MVAALEAALERDIKRSLDDGATKAQARRSSRHLQRIR